MVKRNDKRRGILLNGIIIALKSLFRKILVREDSTVINVTSWPKFESCDSVLNREVLSRP